jgi:putative endopeptidase
MNNISDLINPTRDFDEYVNGDWLKYSKIPHDQVEWGTFNILSEENILKIKTILEDQYVENINKCKSDINVISTIYKKLLNMDDISNKKVISKILKFSDLIDSIGDVADIGIVLGCLVKLDIMPFFTIMTNEDPKNTDFVKLTLCVPTLSLPEKEYYIDPKLESYVNEFKINVQKTFIFFGFNSQISTDMANDVIIVENLIACAQKSADKKRHLDKLYWESNIEKFITEITETLTLKQLSDKKKRLYSMWINFFREINIERSNNILISLSTSIVIYDISFFKKITILLHEVPLIQIKNYMKYIVLRNMGKTLIEDFDDILFEFFAQKLHGQTHKTPRYKRVINYLNSLVGDILGKEYVTRYFDSDAKKIVMSMIENIREEMKLSLQNATWLSGVTKKRALIKLSTFKTKIGYPDKWKDCTKLIHTLKDKITINDCNLLDVILRIKMYDYETNIFYKVSSLKDPHKWSMNPQEVNAYYDPLRNEIVFPAGILQKPFFDKDQSISQNYGGIGTVIAHEITHGYDDQGRKYDDRGNVTDWWDPMDHERFNKIAQNMINQYDRYTINDQQINGKLTLGENLADLGGVVLSYRAMIKMCDTHNIHLSITDKQDFFKSFAWIWKKLTKPEKMMSNILSNPHSPGKYRVWILRNIDEFYEIFDANSDNTDTNTMYIEPMLRIRLW